MEVLARQGVAQLSRWGRDPVLKRGNGFSEETSKPGPGAPIAPEDKRLSPGRSTPEQTAKATREPDPERRSSSRRVPEITVAGTKEPDKIKEKMPSNGASSIQKTDDGTSAAPSQSYQPLSYVRYGSIDLIV